MLVKVLAVDGNRIKLTRKAILKEQRAKMGGEEAAPEGADAGGGVTFEGGHERADEPEQNFNREGGERREHSGPRPDGGRHGGRGGRPGGGGGGRGGDRGRGGRGGPRR